MTLDGRLRALAWTSIGCALFVHARSYDFFADDGFIALRYSQNLIERFELAYNPGERVEGFTSPLWVLLVALLGAFGGSLSGWAQALGAACALATLYAVARLWKVFAPELSPWGAVVVGALLAGSASFAAWTMGGLEAPLFALCLTLAMATLGEAWTDATMKRWAVCGTWCALASLARPEGMALIAPALVLAGARSVGQRTWVPLLACALPVVLLLGGYFLFRLSYYGYPLPNTYYVKTTGGKGLVRRGIRYVTAMASEFGWPTVATLGCAIVAPLVVAMSCLRSWKLPDARLVLHVLMGGTCVLFVVYLTRVGGDFLDLYRFVAPILPAAFVLIVAFAFRLALGLQKRLPGRGGQLARWALLAAACVLSVDYARHQLWMGTRSAAAEWYEPPRDAPEKPKGVEPIHWTRMAALQWSSLGRAIGAVAREGDTMATGAAGAAPFAAGLPNLDLFGLNDEWVAHHGEVIGNRPGHQRRAGVAYIQQRKPTYLFAAGGFSKRRAKKLRAEKVWTRRGYILAEVRIDAPKNGAHEKFYQHLYVRKHRVPQLSKHPQWRLHQASKAKKKKSATR